MAEIALTDAQRVLEQAVAVGVVEALARRGFAVAGPGLGEHRAQQPPEVRILDRPE
jgi:hypothetical protein